MSPAAGGPALFLGDATDYVAFVRPELDPADPAVVRAAAEAGVDPAEFAGPGDTWAVLYETGAGEGDGFDLPGIRDAEPAGFAEQLRAELAAATGEFTVDGGAVLTLDAEPAGPGAYAFTARVTPPGDEAAPVTVRTGPLPVADLLSDLDAFLESLA
ncbi:hypothetical protein C6N75_02190 [Streptomyces solincola]|uniref:Uncharacterized protein n=1 Tax=Streptomyces solincola TaxID=2100817 RepID=A0A2S9Q294_9ACTN|nr:hypothetical protein [Streptomyces solincola]PRH80794.1 hypothetical protein C6N75_02190 [Streptomyces solincola]